VTFRINTGPTANQELEDALNGYGSKGWELYEYSAQPKPSEMVDENGQPKMKLECSALLFRRIDGGKIELNIEKGSGITKSKSKG
jgi:hypothetical protein